MSGLGQAFVEGLLNPVVVPAHALALVALGLFVGRQAGRGVTLLIFAAALIGGLIALTFAIEPTAARFVLLADAAIVGVLVATAWEPPRPVSWLLAAIAGAAIALDSPPQALTIAEGNATLVGTALGACAALLAVSLVAGYASGPWAQLGVRILGSWIAASAILVLAVLLK
jgi:hydrogenase/urease accessory protein HupE